MPVASHHLLPELIVVSGELSVAAATLPRQGSAVGTTLALHQRVRAESLN